MHQRLLVAAPVAGCPGSKGGGLAFLTALLSSHAALERNLSWSPKHLPSFHTFPVLLAAVGGVVAAKTTKAMC